MIERKDLIVLWAIDSDSDQDGFIVVTGAVYRKDERVLIPIAPRTTCDLRFSVAVVYGDNVTFGRLVELAEERFAFDLHEINGTGPFSSGAMIDRDFQRRMRGRLGA